MNEYKVLRKLISEIVRYKKSSPVAFFLGSDADETTKENIKLKGYTLIEGSYDTLVYHKEHWDVIQNNQILKLTSNINSLPSHGLLEAGVNFPYSHAIVPKSPEAKKVMTKLFGLKKNQTFGQLIEAKMTRREFLKGLGKGAVVAKKLGGLGSILMGAPTAAAGTGVAISSVAGKMAADWLSTEAMYAATKAALYDRWKKFKSKLSKKTTDLTKGEVATIDNMIEKIDPEEFKSGLGAIHNPFKKYELSPEDQRNMIYKDKVVYRSVVDVENEFVDEEIAAWELEHNKDGSSERKEDSEQTDSEQQTQSSQEDDYDGFDDIKPKKSPKEDQGWMGEAKVGIPSIKHMQKAYSKKIWNSEIDKILS